MCGSSEIDAAGRGHDCACLYRACHWLVWPCLVATPWARNLVVEDEDSWSGLWGKMGAELFRSFALGDRNIRRDMILRARHGGNPGLAARLNAWRRVLERRGEAAAPKELGHAAAPFSSAPIGVEHVWKEDRSSRI